MSTINPNLLRELRERTGLSRYELSKKAGCSERQLARLEKGGDAVTPRENTLKGLAIALDVTVPALLGEEPPPKTSGITHSAMRINPQTLRALRELRGLTREELAEKAKISERQVARLESTRKDARSSTRMALAAALNVEPEALACPARPTLNESETVQMGFKFSPQLRLAFDLVKHRYGPTRRQVVELAPLLFTLLAESCLQWRRQCLSEVNDTVDHLKGLGKANHLYFANYLVDAEHGAVTEKESIEKADLLGDVVRAGATPAFDADHLYNVTPFADYLAKFTSKLNIDGIVDFSTTDPEGEVGFESIWGANPYQVCRDLLTELTGGSRHARWALVHGDVTISKIPKVLLDKEERKARIAWLESQLSDETKRLAEEQEEQTLTLLRSLLQNSKDVQSNGQMGREKEENR